jgi:hypothetical protein
VGVGVGSDGFKETLVKTTAAMDWHSAMGCLTLHHCVALNVPEEKWKEW